MKISVDTTLSGLPNIKSFILYVLIHSVIVLVWVYTSVGLDVQEMFWRKPERHKQEGAGLGRERLQTLMQFSLLSGRNGMKGRFTLQFEESFNYPVRST